MNITKVKINPKKLFKSEDSRFFLFTGLKFAGIFAAVSLFVYYVMWVIISMNSVLMESKGVGTSEDLRAALTESLFQTLWERFPLFVAFCIVLFFAGVYFGKILLRPFAIIGAYSLKKVEGENPEYNPDIFSDYKLLTRFSEFFFRYLDECLQEKRFKDATIPPTFTRIHKPPFERVFFFHFLLLVLILTIVTVFATVFLTSEFQGQLVELSIQVLKIKDQSVPFFIKNQAFIFESVVWTSVVLIIVAYISLSFHLYTKVDGGIFAFFSTMRSFMKGNNSARVHLLGYAAIRPHGRAFNKYLDYAEKQCSKDKNTVE